VTSPPVPHRLAGRPTLGGLVVPFVSLEQGGRHHLGQTRGLRVAECIAYRLCQVCGEKLTDRPILFLGTQSMVDEGFSAEPAVHPECGAYSILACPMVAGRMATYAKHPHDATGAPCELPGCDCGGFVVSNESPVGAPAEPWLRIWVDGYAIGVRDASEPITVGNVTGAVFIGRIVKTRPIGAPQLAQVAA